VISRDGRIVKHFSGFSPYSTPQLMRQAIEDALNDKSKAWFDFIHRLIYPFVHWV